MADDQFPLEWTDRQAVVGFPGHVDVSNVSQLRDRLLSVINRSATVLIADMTDAVIVQHSLADRSMLAGGGVQFVIGCVLHGK